METVDTKSSTILVVDDIAENLQLLIDILGDHNYTIRPASDGEFAIKYATSDPPDLILLDIRMPGLSGYDVCKTLKSNEITKDIPVIFISAADDISDIKTGFDVGGVDYITKPFNDEEVIVRVKNHLILQRLKQNLKTKNAELKNALERERKMIEDLRLNLSLSLPHELRTPLNGILGFSELLAGLTELPTLSEITEYAKAINASGKRLYRLVENSLIYADLKLINYTAANGKIREMKKTPLYIMEIVEAVAKRQAYIANRTEDLQLDLEDIEVIISSDNLEKILIELLTNAFFFSKPETLVKVKLKKTKNENRLEISDYGVGLDSEQISSLGGFMQFQRQKYAQQGMGFGLTIASLLIRMENGKMEIESKKGVGTTFRLLFPLFEK
ncbi:MAG: hybrid sensor histidine kinase/response regulator [Leptospirales bacterium]